MSVTTTANATTDIATSVVVTIYDISLGLSIGKKNCRINLYQKRTEKKMLRRKVRGYDSFRCIAGDCPQTCCAGWLIEIDDEALEGYQKETSAYGETLRARIDWEEKVFRQYFMPYKGVGDVKNATIHGAV